MLVCCKNAGRYGEKKGCYLIKKKEKIVAGREEKK